MREDTAPPILPPMKPAVTPQEFAQIRISLEQAHKIDRFRGLVFMFWGLIFAKGFLAEWALRVWDAPVSSFYIWAPTLLFGIVGTAVYASKEIQRLSLTAITGRLVATLWAGIAIVAVLISGLLVQAAGVEWDRIPGILAVLLGLGYFVHGVLDPRIWYRIAAGGWWLASIWLFAVPGVDALLWFSLAILAFQVVPSLALYFNWPRRRSVPF